MMREEMTNMTINPLDEESDPIAKTGCQSLNETVLLCFDEHKDWRMCQREIMAFKTCFEAYTNRIKQGQSSD